MDTIEIWDITYKVIKTRTADQMEAEGYPKVAEHMRQNNVKLDLIIQRPAGHKMYWVIQWSNGVYGTVQPIP